MNAHLPPPAPKAACPIRLHQAVCEDSRASRSAAPDQIEYGISPGTLNWSVWRQYWPCLSVGYLHRVYQVLRRYKQPGKYPLSSTPRSSLNPNMVCQFCTKPMPINTQPQIKQINGRYHRGPILRHTTIIRG